MPVTGTRKRHPEAHQDYSSVMGLGHINTTGFLFGDDDEKAVAKKESATSPDVKSYLQMNATDDKFPILVRREEYPGLVGDPHGVNVGPTPLNGWLQLSASSAALDLALSQSPGPESQVNGWSPFAARHRHSQHSLPQNVFNAQSNGPVNTSASSSGSQQSPESIVTSGQLNRRSMEATLASYPQASRPGPTALADGGRPALANVQSSYSTNDIPTVKSINGAGGVVTPTKSHAQQQFHNHNASLGRIPPNGVSNRQSRDLSGAETRREEPTNAPQSVASALQASAAPFGPSAAAASPAESPPVGLHPINAGSYAAPTFYGGYGMQLMNMGMSPIQMANPLTFNHQMPAFAPQNPFAPYQAYGPPARFADSQARVIQQRRMQNGEGIPHLDPLRFSGLTGSRSRAFHQRQIGAFTRGNLWALQGPAWLSLSAKEAGRTQPRACASHFLGNQPARRRIDDRYSSSARHRRLWLTGVDPFGNYLCQKLLEFSNDDQRTVLINNAATQMVKIALNQHGTRALQKMIEFISTREQAGSSVRRSRPR